MFGRKHPNRGCEYCASDDNMYFGHVEQIASDEPTRTLLLRCRRCGWLYQVSPRGPKDARAITQQQAKDRFGYQRK